MVRFLLTFLCLLLALGTSASSQIPDYEKQVGLPSKLESQLGEMLVSSQATKVARSMGLQSDRFDVIVKPAAPYSVEDLISALDGQSDHIRVLRKSKYLVMLSATLGGLEALSKMDEVLYVRRPVKPMPAAVVSEGLDLLGTLPFDVNETAGSGVDIAVIDGSFELLGSAQLRGELPTGVIADMTGDGIEGGGDAHGTACAEIVHDIAPAARLHYVRVDHTLDLQNAVQYVIDNDIDVVSMSLGFLGSSAGDGIGQTPGLVDEAVANGVFWVNSAGNHANKIATDTFRDLGGNGYHDFGDDFDLLAVHDVEFGDLLEISLTWEGWPLTVDDYDLDLWRLDGGNPVRVAFSHTFNFLLPPTERIRYLALQAGLYGVTVSKAPLATSLGFQVVSKHHTVGDGNPRTASIATPADASGSFTVGAIDFRNWTSGPVEAFSSRGPTTDGRLKPEVVAPDAVSTTSYPRDFFGTSASCPHVAGAAAILISSDPYFSTPERVRRGLLDATIDMGEPGPDNLFGYGRLDLRALLARQVPNIALSSTSIDLGETGESASTTLTVENTGQADLDVRSIIADSGDFTFSPSRFSVGPSQSRTVTATFTPSSDGPITSTATIRSNAERVPDLRIELRGVGRISQPLAAQLVISIVPRAFGTVSIGSGTPLYVPVTNSGTGPMSLSLNVKGSSTFSLASTSSTVIEPGTTEKVRIDFSPHSIGSFSADLILMSNDPRRPSVTIPLAGVGARADDTFSISLDLDPAQGDQKVRTLPSKESSCIQIFSADLQAASGLTLRIETDMALSSFTAGGAFPAPAHLQRVANQGVIELSVASLGGIAARTTYVGRACFGGESTTGSVTFGEVTVRRNETFERYPAFKQSVSFSSGPNADFDGDGEVGFADFLLFASVFGKASGDSGYSPQFDLDSDGEVGFSDFLAFAVRFGA